MSVSGHALRCGPETSVTSPLRKRCFGLRALEDMYPVVEAVGMWESRRDSKECGKGGKPASWLSMLSILCHFHGLFCPATQIISCATWPNTPHTPRPLIVIGYQ